mgnify:CR=1 FL=1
MNKCIASENGICRNVYAFNIKCDGYSKECKLKPAYDTLQNTAQSVAESIIRVFGIVGDNK